MSTREAEREADLTIVIVNYNTRQLLRPCIDAIHASAGSLHLQIVIIDNGSRDGSAEVMKAEFGDCELVFNPSNIGFGRANNLALPKVRGAYVLLLNTDAFVAIESLESTVRYMEANPAVSVLGVRLIGRDGELQPSCRYFPTPWNEFLSRTGLARLFPGTKLVDDMAWAHDAPRECDWVPGCYYLVRKSVLDRVGLFDPRFFLYYEEVDHCRAVKAAGGQVVFYSGTTVVHIGGESAKSDSALTAGRQIPALQIESGLLYFRKHHGLPGVWLAAVLATVGDAVLAIKAVVRRAASRPEGGTWQHSAATWSLLLKTSFGRRPTR